MKDKILSVLMVIGGVCVYGCIAYAVLLGLVQCSVDTYHKVYPEEKTETITVVKHDTLLLPKNHDRIRGLLDTINNARDNAEYFVQYLRTIDPYNESSDEIMDNLTVLRKKAESLRTDLGKKYLLGRIESSDEDYEEDAPDE